MSKKTNGAVLTGSEKTIQIVMHIILVFLSLCCLYPFLVILGSSFQSQEEIMSVGYNGFPRGCSDDEFPWEREGDKSTLTKYPYVCHAELNAILNAGGNSLKGCRIYVALFPCNECAKAIIQCGIKEVVYISDKYKDTDNVKASKKMFEYAGVKLTHFSSNKKLTIDFDVDTI